MMLPKQNRIRSEKHRRFIASLPCAITGIEGQSQCAHVSEGRLSMGMKACDSSTVPLHWFEHDRQTKTSEKAFWLPWGGIDAAKSLARLLWENTGDSVKCEAILRRFQQGDL